MLHNLNDSGKLFKSKYGCDITSLVAGSAQDNADYATGYIDRTGFLSGSVNFHYDASLTSAKTLSATFQLVDSTDGTNPNTTTTIQAKTCLVQGAGTEVKDCKQVDVNLQGYAQYVKFIVTPDLSHTSTDWLDGFVSVILGGAVSLPAHS